MVNIRISPFFVLVTIIAITAIMFIALRIKSLRKYLMPNKVNQHKHTNQQRNVVHGDGHGHNHHPEVNNHYNRY